MVSLKECDPSLSVSRSISRRIVALSVAVTTFALAGCTHEGNDFEGGCEPFRLYAQNRWNPVGAAAREAPSVESAKIGSYAPNEIVVADGWVNTGIPAYPTNHSPWDSGVY